MQMLGAGLGEQESFTVASPGLWGLSASANAAETACPAGHLGVTGAVHGTLRPSPCTRGGWHPERRGREQADHQLSRLSCYPGSVATGAAPQTEF